jgi:hypothetical protein
MVENVVEIGVLGNVCGEFGSATRLRRLFVASHQHDGEIIIKIILNHKTYCCSPGINQ